MLFSMRTASFRLWAEAVPAPGMAATNPTTPAVQNSLT